MRRVGQLTGCAFFLLSVGLGYASSSLKYYTPLGPGPGFFPVWMCIFLGLLSLCVVVQSSRHSPVGLPNEFFPTRRGALRMLVVVVELFLLALLLPVLGFRLTMLAFYVITLVLLGRRNPFEIVFFALIGSFGAFYLFVEFLSQPLPVGVLGI